ncbi:MAG: hypothetical protein OXG35_06915 [Acidobacteria bacterium]|nr:hypothetical protein [Acidobacteriota bacterium]
MRFMGHVSRLPWPALGRGRIAANGGRRHAALAVMLLAALEAGDAVGQSAGLFRAVEPASLVAAPGSETATDSLTLRRRLVVIDFGQLAPPMDAASPGAAGPSGMLRLNLFDDASFTGLVERTASTFSGGYSLSGRLAGVEMGTVTLVVNGEVVAGTVRTPEATYRIRPTAGGLHAVSQIDPSRLPPLGEPIPRRSREGDGPPIEAAPGTPPASR